MKVLMTCDYPYDPSEIIGGTSSAAYHLVQSLLRHTDLEVATFSFWPGCSRYEYREECDGRLHVHRFPRRERLRWLVDYLPQRRDFRRIVQLERPDLVHAQGEFLYASLAVRSGLPHVFTIHGIVLRELEMIRKKIGPLRHWVRTRMVKDVHARAANIIAINRYTRETVAHLRPRRLVEIRNAISPEFFALHEREEPEPGRLLLVGGLRWRKDIKTALNALRAAVEAGIDARLSITGPTRGEYGDEIRRAITDLGLQERVTTHGLVDIEDLYELYRRADLFLLSSVEESSPISIVEAMGAGKPIVSTDVGGIAETVSDGVNGILVESGDHAGLARAIVRLVGDRELRNRMGAESHRLAVASWSAEAVAARTHQLYREMIDDA